MTTFDLLLVGFGNVARRFVSLLAEHRAALARDFGVTTRVVGIATRRHGRAYAAAGLPPSVVSGFSRTHTGTNGPPKELVNKSLPGGARAFQASEVARLPVPEAPWISIERRGKASPSFDQVGCDSPFERCRTPP